MRTLIAFSASLALLSCGVDRITKRSCPETVMQTTTETVTVDMPSTTNQSAFDIDEVSVLEATDNLYGGADAVILDHDATTVPDGGTWRVSSVDVLVMVRAADYNTYPASVGETSVGLTVQVWDTNTPLNRAKPAYSVHQTLVPSQLTWSTAILTSGTWRRAWWTFKFAEPMNPVIPASGMTASQFLVGVKWDSSFEPQLGYSNFNRPCDRNWTDTAGTGAWTLNSSLGNTASCNWPMLRVNTEVTTQVPTTVTQTVTKPVTIMVERDVCDPNYIDPNTDAGTP